MVHSKAEHNNLWQHKQHPADTVHTQATRSHVNLLNLFINMLFWGLPRLDRLRSEHTSTAITSNAPAQMQKASCGKATCTLYSGWSIIQVRLYAAAKKHPCVTCCSEHHPLNLTGCIHHRWIQNHPWLHAAPKLTKHRTPTSHLLQIYGMCLCISTVLRSSLLITHACSFTPTPCRPDGPQ